MNCWEILGIDPTRDRAAIERAYEQQKKFAAGEELTRLHQAYQEASGEQPKPAEPELPEQPEQTADAPQVAADIELSAQERQVVREVVIQIKALLNDSRRVADEGIWRAILAEPPADQPHVRAAIAQELEPQIRPMAENGSFPVPVVKFIGDWFDWHQLKTEGQQAPDVQISDQQRATQERAVDEDSGQPDTSFWPAVIGWVVALAVLAAFFEGIFGG